MEVYKLDPKQDARWGELVQSHPKGSVFQTVGWLEALRRTYRYRPVVFTTSRSDVSLENGVVFCDVRSWLTGKRLVSLPFSDHCDPLFDSQRDFRFVLNYLQEDVARQGWKYLELRPLDPVLFQKTGHTSFQPIKSYCFHRVDLRPELRELFRSLDVDSAQRRISRAVRAGVIYERGTSEKLLNDFYRLLVLTRQRHGLPPQPLLWFQNLIRCMNGAIDIWVAYSAHNPIAAILTLRFRTTVYYKYGSSDPNFKHLAGRAFLLWKTIEESKAAGAEEFDLGRSDTENAGLISFKNHWTQSRSELTYLRFPAAQLRPHSHHLKAANWLFACLPKRLRLTTGRLLYRHIG